MLGPKIGAFTDDHPSKPGCLRNLSQLYDSIGNLAERKPLLIHTLQLRKQQRDDYQVGLVLADISDTNRQMELTKERMQQARKDPEIFEKPGRTADRAETLTDLAWLLHGGGQLDAAEEVTSRAIEHLPPDGEQLRVCRCHHVLGYIFDSKGETEKAIHHFEIALGIASSGNLTATLSCLGSYHHGESVFSRRQVRQRTRLH